MVKNIITGSSGFIGRHLTEKLDDFISIPHGELDTITPQECDTVFYLASYGNLYHQIDEKEIVKANLLQPYDLALKTKCRSFVYISTSSVNLNTQTHYSATKLLAEKLLPKANTHVAIVRPYSITGVGEQAEHLIPTLIRAAYSGEKIKFVPDPVHDFVDVEDFVDALLFIANTGFKGVYEVGNGQPVSNQEVKDLVELVTKKKINTENVSTLRSYDAKDWYCKDDTLKNLGWEPQKSLAESILEMVEAYERTT